MLVFSCKQCKHFAIKGYKNEYDEYFCSVNCYKKYCKNNNYETNTKHLKEIFGRR